PRVRRLGGDEAEIAGGQVAGVGDRANRRDEAGQAGDPQPPGPDRGHVLGPGIDAPHLDAGSACEVRRVQAPDRTAADDRDANRDGALGHDPASALRAMSWQTAGSPPPTPRPATTRPASRAGRPPGRPSTGGTTRPARASAGP